MTSKRRTNRVVLVNPNRMKPAVAPIALDYLAHALEESGFQVDVLDLCFTTDFQHAISEYFSQHGVIAVGVTLRNTDDTYYASQDFFLPPFKEVTDCLKAHTSAPIVVGGAGFSIMPEAILSYCGLDLGIWGEGEHSLPLLIAKIAAGEEFSSVPALIYRTKRGFHHNIPIFFDLSKFNARRSIVDNQRYFAEGGMGNIESKRGCAKKCIYCADPVSKGRQLRLRSPDSVADEIESLLEAGVDHFHFCDSEFNLPQIHAQEVCLKLIERGLGERIRWYAYTSPVPFSDELATLFRKAGCAGIDFGVDSGTDEMLYALGRDFQTEELKRTAEVCHRQGIIFMYDLLLGGPGETRKSLRQGIETMKRLSPSRVGAALGVRIFPNTRLAELVREQGSMAENVNLRGAVIGNENFFAPIFYLSAALGADAEAYLAELVNGDERFFIGSKEGVDKNYNYNENTRLVKAIKAGYRGAFWDILRRIAEKDEL